MTPGRPKHVILYLAANPDGTTPLALNEESDAISEQLNRDPYRNCFEFKPVDRTQPIDLLHQLRKLKPTVVHFSCHGRKADTATPPTSGVSRDLRACECLPGLYLQGSDGGPQLVTPETLRTTFGVAGGSVKLVVLNACYSEPIARALLRHVKCVVGMDGAILDAAARHFAIEFYRHLALGGSVAEAVDEGRLGIELNALPGRDLPRLRARKGIDPDELVLARDPLAKRMLDSIGANLRLGRHLAGATGIAICSAIAIAGCLAAQRTWSAFGDSTLDIRTQSLGVDAASTPEAIQGNRDVRAIFGSEVTVERESHTTMASDVPRRVALTGSFNAIELGRREDPSCQWIFRARAEGLGVTRVTPDEQGCLQDVIVRAGLQGLELRIDDAPPIAVPALERLVLRSPPGKAIILEPWDETIVVLRPATDVVWPVTGLRGVAAPGERVRLPGALRDSDTFELDGEVEIRELMLDGGRLAVLASLRSWSGTVGGRNDWNAAAPWPRAQYCWIALAVLLALASIPIVRARNRWKTWGKESA